MVNRHALRMHNPTPPVRSPRGKGCKTDAAPQRTDHHPDVQLPGALMVVGDDDTGQLKRNSETSTDKANHRRNTTMRFRLNYVMPLLGATAAAAAIAAAPIAAAAPAPAVPSTVATAPTAPSDPAQGQQSCTTLGGTQTECQSPGNAQVYDAPPQVDFFPYAGGGT